MIIEVLAVLGLIGVAIYGFWRLGEFAKMRAEKKARVELALHDALKTGTKESINEFLIVHGDAVSDNVRRSMRERMIDIQCSNWK